MSAPPVVRPGAPEVGAALGAGAVVVLPTVGGYSLAVLAVAPEAGQRLGSLGPSPGDGDTEEAEPHYLVGEAAAVRALTAGWSDELAAFLARCWPGPVEVRVRGDGDTVTVGMPATRALRKLCRQIGPWRTRELGPGDAAALAAGFRGSAVACVLDGGERRGAPSTVVDATAAAWCVVREGALPASFVEGALLMSTRRRWFANLKESRRRGSP